MTATTKIRKAGDVVRIKSGGPWMTVSYTWEKYINNVLTEMSYCQWFTGSELKEESFLSTSLETRDND